NNSCAYDATIFILFNLWNVKNHACGVSLGMEDNTWMQMLGALFAKFSRHEYTLEVVRDYFRRQLHREFPNVFVFSRFISIESIMMKLLKGDNPFLMVMHKCTAGHEEPKSTQNCCMVVPTSTGSMRWSTVQEYINNCRAMPPMFNGAECAECGADMVLHHTFMYSPSILAVCIAHTTTPPDMSFELPIGEGATRYTLMGIVYHGDAHFTS
ncbi:hypothetical protein ARMGADRAFT_927792, partial [Armillaria gallica]